MHISQHSEMAESATKQLECDPGDAEQAELERIRSAIGAYTWESLESVGGLLGTPKTVCRIFVRRGSGPARAPVPLTTEARDEAARRLAATAQGDAQAPPSSVRRAYRTRRLPHETPSQPFSELLSWCARISRQDLPE
ncbi:MAG: hypothetical protein OXJ55_03140 [Caldilineaceae bacterium]|nr:hypothetical protein [Caldilineaceae bacterium]